MNSLSIFFDCKYEDGFEMFIIPEGMATTLLICCVHRTLIQ